MSRTGPSKPVRALLDRLGNSEERTTASGISYRALCPAHDDRNTPNLDITEGDDGRALLLCRAGCETEAIVGALGLRMADLFVRQVRKGGGHSPPDPAATLQPPCTLEAYARAKDIPASLLKTFGLSDLSYAGRPAVRIPYRDRQGVECAMRFRLALQKGPEGDERFRWRKGSSPSLYGLWRLERMLSADPRRLFLVEGESDCHTLWHHGIPALGVPGAANWRDAWATELDGIPNVYALVEPDAGGEAFWTLLAASPLRERLWRMELDGVKDVSELHLNEDARYFGVLFEQACSGAVACTDMVRDAERARSEAAWDACEGLARKHDILAAFEEELAKAGFAGETRAAKVLFLALVSRLLPKIVSVAVKGPSSGGKSYLVEQVLRFFPEEAYHALTAMSDRTLAYSEEPIEHRFLVLFEADGMSGDFATYLIRSLLSEGRLLYETVEKTAGGMKPRLIERQGPTGLIVTTTAVRLHPENETRLLSLTVNDTREQTRHILAAIAREEKQETDLSAWRALQEWLGGPAASREVTIPYAQDLAALIPPVAVRLRRDFGALLSLVRAHALLHQARRQRMDGRVVASVEDYAAVRALVADLVAEGVEATVPASVRFTVRTVAGLLEGSDESSVTVAAVARELELDRSAALRRVKSAIERGHLKNLEDRRGRPARLVLGDPVPEDLEILPPPEKLKGCRVAVNFGGITSPSPRALRSELKSELESFTL